MAHTICTFNANNLFARYRFSDIYPGDKSGKSRAPAEFAYLPMDQKGMVELFNEEQREITALALKRGNPHAARKQMPDVICLQEIESMAALRVFNDTYLGGMYSHAILIDGRDLRNIDVALLTNLEILQVRSHLDDLDTQASKPRYLFSRDCLEVVLALNTSGSETLTLFVNHLKSKYAESAQERRTGDALRCRQADGVRRIAHDRFPGEEFDRKYFAVIGDMNDEPASPHLEPLVKQAQLVDAFERIATECDRWTHWYSSENSVSQLDHILLSPRLARDTGNQPPEIERRGIGFSRVLQTGQPGPKTTRFFRHDNDAKPIDVPFQFKRFAGVSPKQWASDHCPVFLELP